MTWTKMTENKGVMSSFKKPGKSVEDVGGGGGGGGGGGVQKSKK
jgi:hypothetical protein